MSLKNRKNENDNEVRKHQNRGGRGLEEDAVQRQREQEQNFAGEAAQYQGEYHEEGKPVVRGNTQAGGGHGAGRVNKATMKRDGKGGIGQNNLGQLNDRDDDFQSGSKGGNRSGKTGTRQGGSRGKGTM